VSNHHIIRSREGLGAVHADLGPVMDLAVRLPESPFRDKGTDSVCEFEWFRGGEFGPLLAALAAHNRDEYVSGLSVDPDSDYFSQFYGTRGAFRVPASEIGSAYWDALSFWPNEDITGALLFAADVFCVVGSSGRWGVWGERKIGIAIVHTDSSDISWRQGSDLFVPAEAALSDFVEPNFNRRPLGDDFRETFRRVFRFADE
jgi:hypothetical protein